MFEFHAWIVITSYAQCDPNDRERDRPLLNTLAEKINGFDRAWSTVTTLHEDLNGLRHVLTSNGVCNHRLEPLFELFEWLAENGPGSYGLLYFRDGEDEEDDNRFRIWRLARGTIDKTWDHLLSPCVPVIEDAIDPSRIRWS